MSHLGEITIRSLRVHDPLALRTFLLKCWRATYDAMPGVGSAGHSAGRFSLFEVLRIVLIKNEEWGLGTKLVATDAGSLVGFIQASEHPKGQINIWMLYVDPQFQRRGIGSALISAVEQKYADASRVRLEVIQQNEAAIDWYSRLGFRIYLSAPQSVFGSDVAVHYMERPLPAREPTLK